MILQEIKKKYTELIFWGEETYGQPGKKFVLKGNHYIFHRLVLSQKDLAWSQESPQLEGSLKIEFQ